MVFLKRWGTSLVVVFLGIILICVCLANFSRKVESSIEAEVRHSIKEIRDNAIFTFESEIERFSNCLVDEARALSRMKDFTDAEIYDEINKFVGLHGFGETLILMLDGTKYSNESNVKSTSDLVDIDKNLLTSRGDVSSPKIVYEADKTYLEIATAVFSEDEPIAILQSRYNVSVFEKMFTEHFMKGTCSIGLATSDGSVLAGRGTAPILDESLTNIFDLFSGEDVSFIEGSAEGIKRDLEAGKSGFAIYTGKTMTRYLSYAHVGVNDWFIAAICNGETLIAQTGKINTFSFHLILELFIIVAAITVWVLLNRARDSKLHLSELSKVAYIDSLTGAANKKRFKMVASKLLEEKGNSFAFVVIDIDKFKVLNDTLGYDVGDELLCIIADNLQANIQNAETFGRCDSDEYYLLLQYDSNENIERRVMTIFGEIQAEFNKRLKNNYNLVLCAGIYAIHDFELTVNVIMDRAKHAHQLAKGNSHSSIAFYSEALHNRILDEKIIENKMYDALENSDYLLYLQPKYELNGEILCGAEALVRWDTGNSPMLFPDQFIPVFEKTGFITKLDMYMLEKSCILIRSWIDQGVTPVPISINFSRVHLLNSNFVEDIATIVKLYDVPPRFIEIELTESTMMHNEELLINVLSQLHEYGFALSMDDFGSGYSSLGLLKNLPVDTIKMDRTFFTQYNDIGRAKTVISNMIKMAKELGIFTVAEGVETKENIDLLHELGCDIVQGYYFAKPMKASDFNELPGLHRGTELSGLE